MENKKEKSIETLQLLIKGNIMCWEGTMIQLSNVSCVSTVPLELMDFPKLSILFILGGLVGFGNKNVLFGLICAVIGCGWIYYWYSTNERRKLETVLNVIMNSGNNLKFLVKDKMFLNNILRVLERIIIDGGVGKQSISIDMKGCMITGNASVLNDLNINGR